MKREDVIAIAKSIEVRATETSDGGLGGVVEPLRVFRMSEIQLHKLVNLVEQATLDRAAKVCREQAEIASKEAMQDEEDGDEESSEECKARAWSLSVAAKLILALKDSHD